MKNEHQQLQAEFCKVDLDDNGKINLDEFVRLLQSLGLTRQDEVIRLAFSNIDADSSGQISFSEFSDWWQKDGNQKDQQ